MSRNNKNARLCKQAKEMSAARQSRKAAGGEPKKPGRCSAPKHTKTNAWWQRNITYTQFIKGGAKAGKSRRGEETDTAESVA